MIILYGSQTGTSRCVSELVRRAVEHGFHPETIYNLDSFQNTAQEACAVMEMDAFSIEKIFDVSFAVFVCSTHGDGAEPFNMSRFWAFISRADLPAGILCHLRFAVFGLGDSSYEKYNYCSKRLFNRLSMLGATPVVRRGAGDAQDPNGFLTGLRPWIQELTAYIASHDIQHPPGDLGAASEMLRASLVQRTVLTPREHSQTIMELVFHIPEYTEFTPGDCLGFHPTNPNHREFAEFNRIEDCEYIRTTADFNSCPQQPFFFALRHILRGSVCSKVLQKIEEIATDYSFYHEYILQPRRTVFETIRDLQVTVDLAFVRSFIPQIYPRFFSVTRKGAFYHITAAVVRFFTTIREPRTSICSKYLSRLRIGDAIHIAVGRSNLFFGARRLLFLCTGVGISLPRACVNEFRDKEITVFYGFRHRDRDFLYAAEWEGANVRLFTAASRDDGEYIQDVFRRNPVQSIDDCLVFVSGNSRLSKEAAQLLQEVYGRRVVFQSETW